MFVQFVPRRNIKRFPADFMCQMSQKEFESLRSHFATIKTGRGKHRKYLPYVFTEQGIALIDRCRGKTEAEDRVHQGKQGCVSDEREKGKVKQQDVILVLWPDISYVITGFSRLTCFFYELLPTIRRTMIDHISQRRLGIIMQEFVRVRVAIDSLIDKIKLSIQNKSLSGSMEQLEEACGLIQVLKQMSTTDQAAIVAKRETTIASLTDIAGNLKKPAIKKRSMKETIEKAATL